MRASVARGAPFRARPRLIAWGLSALMAAVFVAANAHLVAVSFASHPGCAEPPVDPEGRAAPFRPAKRSC